MTTTIRESHRDEACASFAEYARRDVDEALTSVDEALKYAEVGQHKAQLAAARGLLAEVAMILHWVRP